MAGAFGDGYPGRQRHTPRCSGRIMSVIENLGNFPGTRVNFSKLSIFHYDVPARDFSTGFRFINNVYLILDGKYRYLHPDGGIVEAKPRDIVLLPYGSAYKRVLLSGDSLGSGLCLDFRMVGEDGQELTFPPYVTPLATDTDGYYEKLYRKAMREQLDAHGGFAFRATVYDIFDKLFAEADRFPPGSPWHDIAPAINIIERSPQNNRTVVELAGLCKLSETRFRQLFRSYTDGMNPIEYRNCLRVRKAKELLRANPLYSVEKIADMLGFYDAPYFIKTFTRFVGATPKEYRSTVCENESGIPDCDMVSR